MSANTVPRFKARLRKRFLAFTLRHDDECNELSFADLLEWSDKRQIKIEIATRE